MFTFSLTLIRHGETQYNRDKLLQGQGVDTPLSETGVQQAEAVGKYLRDIAFNNVFASNLQRAIQTAEIILKNNTHCSGTEMVLEPLLRERGFGVAEGRPKEELKNMANAAGQSCGDYTPPGGETLDQLKDPTIFLFIMIKESEESRQSSHWTSCNQTFWALLLEVKLRFKKFLKVLFKQMLDEHSRSRPDGSAASASHVAPVGLADDGLQGVPVHALVVSHGAYIRAGVKHLLEDLKSSLPAGVKMSQLFSPCPNTGISRFIFTLSQSESGPVLSASRCLFTNRKHHLENLTAAK